MMLNIHYMISLGLVFVMIATGAYKKSYSTMMFLIAISLAMYFINPCIKPLDKEIALYVVNIISFMAVVRAILHKEIDRLIR